MVPMRISSLSRSASDMAGLIAAGVKSFGPTICFPSVVRGNKPDIRCRNIEGNNGSRQHGFIFPRIEAHDGQNLTAKRDLIFDLVAEIGPGLHDRYRPLARFFNRDRLRTYHDA